MRYFVMCSYEFNKFLGIKLEGEFQEAIDNAVANVAMKNGITRYKRSRRPEDIKKDIEHIQSDEYLKG